METEKPKLVIIGHGMVSHHFCQNAVQENLHQTYDICVFGEEPTYAYDRVKLSELFYGKSFRSLILAKQEWYKEKNIEVKTGEVIDKVDTLEKKVISQNNESFNYDKLIFATGSNPFIPPIEGIDQFDQILTYRNFTDIIKIKNAATHSKRVAIIGGGLLGLEAARACKELNLDIFVIELAEYLMPKQLNKEAAELLAKTIHDMGIELLLNRQCTKIYKRDEEIIIGLDQDDRLAIDMVIVTSGIEARDEIARASGIECNPRHGIVVDSKMNTSHEDIYAIGECAMHQGHCYGLVSHAYRMSSVLLDQFCNRDSEFTGSQHSTRLKLMGVEVTSLGQPFQQATIVSYTSPENKVYRRLSLQNNKLIGFISLGPWDKLSDVQQKLEYEEKISQQELDLFKSTGELQNTDNDTSYWPDSMVICHCMNINKAAIEKAFQEGAKTVEAIGEKTCAGIVCGSCHPQILQITQADSNPKKRQKTKSLLSISLITSAILFLIYLLTPGWSYSQTVIGDAYNFENLWRDPFYKQVTGYSCLGIFILSIGLALRKRIKALKFGQIQSWQIFHILLISFLYLILYLHTGWRMGDNLNFFLMLSFILATASGLSLALIYLLEQSGHEWLIKWRRKMYWLHIVSFWPFPVLTFFHVFKFYRY